MTKSVDASNSTRQNPILDNLISGGRKSLARAITVIENNLSNKQDILRGICSDLGSAHVIGITGPPGVGKSTLIDACIPAFRALGQSVAVVAVDPSSHISGGAILGDRVRMAQHTADDGVFIRSVAARGHLGGLTSTAQNIIDLFDAAGWDKILVETVGAGQSEIEISEIADTVVVLESPGLGDEIQSIKAGLVEVADFIVVNKADLPKSDLTMSYIKSAIALRHSTKSPKVLKTTSTTGQGIDELVQQVCDHMEIIDKFERNRSAKSQNRKSVARILGESVERAFRSSSETKIDDMTRLIQLGELDPDLIAQRIIRYISVEHPKITGSKPSLN